MSVFIAKLFPDQKEAYRKIGRGIFGRGSGLFFRPKFPFFRCASSVLHFFVVSLPHEIIFKTMVNTTNHHTRAHLLLRTAHLFLLLILSLNTWGQDFAFRYYPPIVNSLAEETHCVFFDREGMMWIGTNTGLKSYDGYRFKTYKSDAYTPTILPNNIVYAITEDHHDNLWIGTRNGLVRMNKRTGVFKTYYLPKENQRIIYTLFTSKDGTVWIGTDGGLTYFKPQTETFYTYDRSNSFLVTESGHRHRMTEYSPKSIIEDRNGDILVGTWCAGLLRLRRGTNVFHRYPKLNETNSAYSLFFDSHHRLWVGTWGAGLIRMDRPDNMLQPQMHQYPYTPNNFDIYTRILEDPISKKLWACTREGICAIDIDAPDAPMAHYTKIGDTRMLFCKSMATDGQGCIWVTTQNSGIMQFCTKPADFHTYDLLKSAHELALNYVTAILTSNGKNFWLGLNPYGVAYYDRTTGATLCNEEAPGMNSLPSNIFTTSISSIVERFNGEIWFALNSCGVIVRRPNGTPLLFTSQNYPFIKDNFVNRLYQTRDHTMWIGQRSGLSVYFANNKAVVLQMQEDGKDLSRSDVRGIMQDRQGRIWLATENNGIIRVTAKGNDPRQWQYHQYCPQKDTYAVNDATNCLQDQHGRLWAISNSGGLFLYDADKDLFLPKNRDYHLQGDRVLAINEDHLGNLWIATDKALARIKGDFADTPEITYFGNEDGLGNMLITHNSTFRYGKEMYFGNQTGFFAFTPAPQLGKETTARHRLTITDILLDNVPLSSMSEEQRAAVSTTMPSYARHITVPASTERLTIEFALLTYGNAEKNLYAYQLEGYAPDWKYSGGSTHHAEFQNLPAGSYTFHLKATDSYGHWQELPYTIQIRILPPWYASWWAYCLYFLLIGFAIYGTVRWYKIHLKTKNRLQMGVILTNITHELLTPLTVISASIYKLRDQAPQYEDDYMLMQNNISRTTRLLRQILEVRKSQAGQLKLRVSKGELVSFITSVCENIRPMTIRSNIALNMQIEQREVPAWFDPDKLDKILYNLLSNAIKYNKENGAVEVSLTTTKDYATIMVKDTGIGIPKEARKHLYTRFFDGDYRKANATGTGIGMSLTHDLVVLHHGQIDCQSSEGQGTTFTITLPIRKSSYTEAERETANKKETDSKMITAITKASEEQQTIHITGFSHNTSPTPKVMSKLLIVEDNDDLLVLMKRVLSKHYQIITARNGKSALNIIQKEELDLVISDVMMPIMDGIELTRHIKENKGYWQLPVILLTAKNRDEDKNEGYVTGADAYITKPFKLEDLEIRINTLLANREKIREKFLPSVDHSGSEPASAQPHFSNPEQVFIQQATEQVMAHLDDPEFDREAFAKEMMMSSSSLYKKLNAMTGKTIVEFVTSIRLQEACRILRQNPDILISDLAQRVGFNTPKYFSRCFKREFGMGVKEFLQQ